VTAGIAGWKQGEEKSQENRPPSAVLRTSFDRPLQWKKRAQPGLAVPRGCRTAGKNADRDVGVPTEERRASEGGPYKTMSTSWGDGEDAEGAAGAVDDFEGGGDDDGAGGGQLIEIAEAGEAELAAAVHDAMI
jgi:hypothetical protein